MKAAGVLCGSVPRQIGQVEPVGAEFDRMAGGSGDGGQGRTIPDYPGQSRTIPDKAEPFLTGTAAGPDRNGGRERLRRPPGTGQAIGKTRVPETGGGVGEVEQGGRGVTPGEDAETRPRPCADDAGLRAARKADHGPRRGRRRLPGTAGQGLEGVAVSAPAGAAPADSARAACGQWRTYPCGYRMFLSPSTPAAWDAGTIAFERPLETRRPWPRRERSRSAAFRRARRRRG